MIGGCLTLGSMQLYLWKYDADNKKCVVRAEAEPNNPASLWSVWSWTTEMSIFLVVPVIILVINILVMREVSRVRILLLYVIAYLFTCLLTSSI